MGDDATTLQWMNWRSGESSNTQSETIAFRAAPWTRHSPGQAPRTKVCPGRSCNAQLSLLSFAVNSNMPDGLDVYCVSCNNRRREARKTRFDPVVDKFELFRSRMGDIPATRNSVMDELHARIDASIADAELTAGRHFKLDATELSRKLLMRHNFICTLTGCAVTPECFLQHHSFRFDLIDVDIKGTARQAVRVACTNTKVS